MVGRVRIWVGIDVGKSAYHVCGVGESGKVVFFQRLVNGQSAIGPVIARVSKAAGQVRWAVDMASGAAGLLVALLVATGQPVSCVMGRTVDRMAGAFGGER